MSCNCFDDEPGFSELTPFDERYKLSKCKCSSRFTVSENASKFMIKSNDLSKVEKVKVDGYFDCSKQHRKCDYLFVYTSDSEQIYIFVELKGSDIVRAVDQIRETINLFYDNNYLNNKKVIGVIVSSRYPSNDGSYRKAKVTLEKSLSSKLKSFRIENKNKKIIYDPIIDRIS